MNEQGPPLAIAVPDLPWPYMSQYTIGRLLPLGECRNFCVWADQPLVVNRSSNLIAN